MASASSANKLHSWEDPSHVESEQAPEGDVDEDECCATSPPEAGEELVHMLLDVHLLVCRLLRCCA